MIQTIAVIGAGTMGHAIAGCFAMYGYTVHVSETFEAVLSSCKDKIRAQYEFLKKEGMEYPIDIDASLGNITLYDNHEQAVADADYIIEAIPEDLELKLQLFDDLDKFCKEDAIFASNTSSLSFESMTARLSPQRKARALVCHWYNPAHIMPLVELSFFGNMKEDVYKEVEELYQTIEKRPVRIRKDIPGLVANRIQQAIAREVFSLIEMEAADPKDIDAALKFGPAFRYATAGQLEVADFGGIDIWSTVGGNLLPVMDNSTWASPILKQKVQEKKLGFKSGEGFFTYPEEKKKEIQEAFHHRLLTQLKASRSY
ncbi:3-hydroxyacyl-CoA dehydrogenase NAD-binding domain-containing protein [Lachnospiraceae bacterium ZAX-1]